MNNLISGFSSVVEKVYSLPLEEKMELQTLLEHNIADVKRNEIAANFKQSQQEEKEGKLKFSDKISNLKKML